MSDLSLVSIQDLFKEIESRCGGCIAAYFLPDDMDNLKTRTGTGRWADSVMLASILQNHVMNNWNGELETLARINDEEKKDE